MKIPLGSIDTKLEHEFSLIEANSTEAYCSPQYHLQQQILIKPRKNVGMLYFCLLGEN